MTPQPMRERRLRDLAKWERLRAKCAECGHLGWVDLDRRRFGHVSIRVIAARLRCEKCGLKGATLEIGPGLSRN